MRKAGLDPDTVLLKTAQLAEQRDLSRWLPLALAGLYCLVCAYGTKHPPTVSEVLKGWGLSLDAASMEELVKEARQEMTEKTLTSFFGKG